MAGTVGLDFTPGPDDEPHLGRLHEETAAAHPDRIALIDGESGDEVTYGEVAERIAAAGNALADLGVERGDRVALSFPNELTFVYAFFGAARLGAVPVPVNVQATSAKMRSVIDDSDASVVVTSDDESILPEIRAAATAIDAIETVAVAAPEPPGIDGVDVVDFATLLAEADASLEPAPVDPDDPAMQPYTSGSTGDPKGVVLTHGGCEWMITCIHRLHFLDEDDRAIVAGPLYHKNAMVGAIKPMLAIGGSVVVMDGFDAHDVIEAIDAHDVTYLRGVPAMYKMLVNATEALADHDVESVDWAVSGSASLPNSLIEDVRDVFSCDMGEAYGLTETGGPITLSPRWGPRKLGSSGLALPGADIRIVDPETNEELPAGETGELVIAAPSNGSYYRRPDTEAEAYFERDGRRFLHTDDLAYQDEQEYHYIVGRLDDMLIVGGENVYPAEVENLLQRHERVRDVAVVGAPHAVKGEAPVAFVVADDVTEEELKQYTLENGPAYAHPRRVFLEDELPLASTGKIDRDALEAAARERIEGGELRSSRPHHNE
jgi:acyl-CoA synthetase (AMP-forming)/AMP-acid ligase II